MQSISVHVLAATRPTMNNIPLDKCGLVTVQIEYPLYLHTELLTHRRLSRNASSARAMGTQRYAAMGYYVPKIWYTQGSGMQSGKPIEDPDVCQKAAIQYVKLFFESVRVAQRLSSFGIAKEQANRVIPPYKMVRAIVTGTEDAWRAFLLLRNHPSADSAMQILAQKIQDAIKNASWIYSCDHRPYPDMPIESAVARIARVSYNRESGKDDEALYHALKEQKHLSPFEHIATWVCNPPLSNFVCKKEDVFLPYDDFRLWYQQEFYGWRQLRANIE